jgi:uncharacterized delta-60 repeat protein
MSTYRSDMAVWRFDGEGTLDSNFGGGDGLVTHGQAAGGKATFQYYDQGYDIALDGTGKILVTGSSDNTSGNDDMVVWRFTDQGALDTSFGGGDGFFTHDNAAGGTDIDEGREIFTDKDGRIIVIGSSRGDYYDMAVWRLNSNGTLDTDFDDDGWMVYDNPSETADTEKGFGGILDASGRIIVVGTHDNGSNTDMAIWRIK